ncbi:MAG: hypothetical protein ACYDB8_11195 [Acidiferrobacterales bacterium]
MNKLVRLIKLNNLQYNANRDPQVYRGVPRKPFHIQAMLGGQGTARAKVEIDGTIPCNQSITLPGTFTCDVSFDTPGVRVATLFVEATGESFTQDIRLDVMEHEWIG